MLVLFVAFGKSLMIRLHISNMNGV